MELEDKSWEDTMILVFAATAQLFSARRDMFPHRQRVIYDFIHDLGIPKLYYLS